MITFPRIMVFRILASLSLLFLLALDSTSQQIVAYQYWYDQDYNSAITVSITPTLDFELDDVLPTTGLTEGFHSLHIQFQDDSQLWSPAMSKMFYIPPEILPGNTIVEAEYWYDHDKSNTQSLTLGGSDSETISQDLSAGLSDGFHQVAFRVKDDQGYWSMPMCKMFYGSTENTPNNVEHYRFWFNGDQVNAQSADVPMPATPYTLDEALSTGDLPEGLDHSISIQFRNTNLLWSPILTLNFDKIIGCYGDLNGDFQVDTGDLLFFLGSFGCTVDCDDGDLNFDGTVDSQDLLIFLSLLNTFCDS